MPSTSTTPRPPRNRAEKRAGLSAAGATAEAKAQKKAAKTPAPPPQPETPPAPPPRPPVTFVKETPRFLIHDQATDFGVNAKVWTIEGYGLNRPKGAVVVTVAGYVSPKAFLDGKQALINLQIALPYEGEMDGLSAAEVRDMICLQGEGWEQGAQ